jgi:hypothetical protein
MNLGTNFEPPADGWFHIAPHGTFPHPTGALQVIDAEACEAMLGTFNEEARAANFPGLLVDFDHFSNDPARASEAAGWIAGLEHRGDGLYARIRWSDLGEEALSGGRYRLVSPVWNRGDCEEWSAPAGAEGRERVHLRPRRLDRLALTNDPNLPGLAPLSNRAESGVPICRPEGEGYFEATAPPPGRDMSHRAAATETATEPPLGRDMSHRAAATVTEPSPGGRRLPPRKADKCDGERPSREKTMNLRNEIVQLLKVPGAVTDEEIVELLRNRAAESESLRNRC